MPLGALALSPILVPQALWVAARATRLPEAAGERSGTMGTGPALRVLVIGDSSAAGVGVAHQSQALGGQLAAHLADTFSVHWKVVAKSGGTTRSTLRLLDATPAAPFDAAVVALGVNDSKNGVALRDWDSRYRQVLDLLSQKFGTRRTCLSGLPPIRHFPALPSPLNRVLGARAERFDAVLRQIAQERPDAVHLPMDFTQDTGQMAEDGFHPGPEVYRDWAARVAALLSETAL